jgi:RNA polymerase sigma-70 factor (ECF subfamily)
MTGSAERPLWQILAAEARFATAASAAFEPLLAGQVAAAQAAWPEVDVGSSAFVAYVAARLSSELPLAEALREVRFADLYLACACVARQTRAIVRFDDAYLIEVDRAVARHPPGGRSRDDVKQLVREKLLVGTADAPPKLAEYTGRGELRGWVRVIVVRTVIDLAREAGAHKRMQPTELFSREVRDPELVYLKQHYRREFGAAFHAALGGLTARQRNLLRQQLLHELTLDEIGALYRVHRAKVVRWLAQARDELTTRTLQELRERIKVSAEELQSIFRLIQSELDVSLVRVLS